MDNANTVKMMQSRDQLSYERPSGGLRQSLLLEVISYMREKLSTFCNLRHQAVEVVGLHGLIEPDDVGMTKPSHQLCFS